MKRRLSVLIILAILLLFTTNLLSAEFWGSKKSRKYHYPTCEWAQEIYFQNLIKFNSPSEATQAGYIPCKVCKPPAR